MEDLSLLKKRTHNVSSADHTKSQIRTTTHSSEAVHVVTPVEIFSYLPFTSFFFQSFHFIPA